MTHREVRSWGQWIKATKEEHMPNINRVASFYEALFIESYCDVACSRLCPRLLRAELRYIKQRISREGISFLTITLPAFGKALDKCLSAGASLSIEGFHKETPDSPIPLFLGWLVRDICNTDGSVREDASACSVAAFRQLTFMFYKLNVPVAKEKNQKVLRSFVSVESELALLKAEQFPNSIVKIARTLVSKCLVGLTPYSGFDPKHGPGAVATGERVDEKTKFSRIYRSIEQIYPFSEWNCYNLTHVADTYQQFCELEECDTGTAKVVLVPKDSRGPRLISCEPLEYQWVQQGLGTIIRDRIEKSTITAGFVNFTNQEVNRSLALLSSKTQEYVTLDMKDASDRVSVELVKELFCGTELLDALLACRTTATKLPNGTVVPLQKFAPMGSNLCFPVEALCFWALSVAAIARTGKPLHEARKCVYVYGDDLIVRTEVYKYVLQYLPQFGLRFNEDKCCTAGFFRESCGCDAYRGVDVTPVRIRKVWLSRRRFKDSPLESYVSYGNSLYERGYLRAARHIRVCVEALYGQLPTVEPLNGTIGWTYGPQRVRLQHDAMHRACALSYQSSSTKVIPKYDGWCEMLRRRNASDFSGSFKYTVRRRTRLKRRWRPVGY